MFVQDKRIWQRTFCDPLPHSFHPETILRVSRDGACSATPKGFVSCSGIFAARTPARKALRLRECCGLPAVNRYHGNLTPPRNAPSRLKNLGREYHCTQLLHHRKQPHHTAVIALRGSLVPFREVLASEAVLLRRSGKIRSTELFSFQGAVKSDLPLFTIPRTKKQLM